MITDNDTHRSVWARQAGLRLAGPRSQSLPCRMFGGKEKKEEPGVHFSGLPICPVCFHIQNSGLMEDSSVYLTPDNQLCWVVEVPTARVPEADLTRKKLGCCGVLWRRVSYDAQPSHVNLYLMAPSRVLSLLVPDFDFLP